MEADEEMAAAADQDPQSAKEVRRQLILPPPKGICPTALQRCSSGNHFIWILFVCISWEVVVSTASDKTTMESLVATQYSLKNVHELVKTTNIAILKIQSILVSKAPKHTTQVMWGMTGAAVLLSVIPFKFAIMFLTVYLFMDNSKTGKLVSNMQGDRRLREWWYAIPVVPVRTTSNPL